MFDVHIRGLKMYRFCQYVCINRLEIKEVQIIIAHIILTAIIIIQFTFIPTSINGISDPSQWIEKFTITFLGEEGRN